MYEYVREYAEQSVTMDCTEYYHSDDVNIENDNFKSDDDGVDGDNYDDDDDDDDDDDSVYK